MKKLFTNRYFLGALGVLALCLLVWFVGDLLALASYRPLGSSTARLIAIIILITLWAVYEGLRVWRAKRTNQALLDGIAEEDDSGTRSAEEVETLKKRFEEGMATLKKARFKSKGGQSQYLYEMPWYVFIGAPGSGKTTALVNSGLRFPLAEGRNVQALKGVGGTRNCDWWFTDEAVLLDTAGRYTTQESDEKVDKAAWVGFLDLLKKCRPKRPLNGALVTLSISDLVAQTEVERDKYAATVRLRLQELYEHLGVRFPVYLIVTKTDLLAGFNEFYASLGREERGQVWGTTFKYKEQSGEGIDFAAAFREEFGQLESRLNARLVDRLQNERDRERRALIYSFPAQVSALGPAVAHFIDGMSRASRFDQQPLVRGVYFTSGTQEGTPIDRVLGALSRNFNLERKVLAPSVSSGKSFFLTRLLQEVVFPEAGLGNVDQKRERLMRTVSIVAYAGIAVLTLGLLGGWGYSYYRNQQLVEEVTQKVTSAQAKVGKIAQPKTGDIADLLGPLNELRDLPFGYAEQKREPESGMRLGLFQGHKLGAQAVQAYRRVLLDALLNRAVLKLEDTLRTAKQPEVSYGALKAYLMLFDDKHLDPSALEAILIPAWERELTGDSIRTLRVDLAGHLKAALEERPILIRDLPRDNALVDEVRKKMATAPLPERVYSFLKTAGVGSDVPPFKLTDVAGPAATQVFVRASGLPLSTNLPGLFTYDGYHKGFRTASEKIAKQFAAEEEWVLGKEFATGLKNLTGNQLVDEVRKRYLVDYAREWDSLLKDIQLRPAKGLDDMLLYARTLSAPDSPLKKLAVAAAKETTLIKSDLATAAMEKAGEALTDSLKAMAQRAFAGTPSITNPLTNKPPEAVVDEQFEPLRRLVTAAQPNAPLPIDPIIALIDEFYKELVTFKNSAGGAIGGMQNLPSINRLRAEADRVPAPLSNVLKSLISAGAKEAAAATKDNVEKALGGAAAHCQKAVVKKFPVAGVATIADIGLEDFNKVFSPGGDLDEFFQKNLAATVDTSGTTWRSRSAGELAAPVSAATIAQFQNAAAVRDAFFKGGSRNAFAQVELAVLEDESGKAQFEYDGQNVKLSAGSAMRIQWPAQRPGAKAVLAVDSTSVNGEGTWALFRLVEKGKPEVNGNRIRLNYALDGKRVTLELRGESVLNPFYLKQLKAFQCPGKP